MRIPAAIQSIAVARLDALNAEIAKLTVERDDLRAWLDAESAPVPAVAPVKAPTPRSTREPYPNIGKEPRPQRLRAGTTETERLFPRGSYSTAAREEGFGCAEVIGVWLTEPEWQLAKEYNRRRKAERERRRGAA